MKSTLLSIAILCVMVFQGIGQIPQKISYQAVLRSADGSVIASQAVDIKISLRKTATNGTIVYSETFNQTTSALGLVNLVIGGGDAVSFAAIPWNENIYIQTEVKKSSESTFMDLGTSQILSVPYALTAGNIKEVKSIPGSNVDDPIFVVKNKDGQIVFAVYQDGVQINIDDKALIKGARGGFAVGGLSQSKGISKEYLRITPDSARIYINDSNAKGARGGFAVGGLSQSKGINQEYLRITPDSTRIYINDSNTKGARGGFAVGGLSQTKGNNKDYFKVTKDTSFFKTTLYTESNIISTGTVSTGAGTLSSELIDIETNKYKTIKIGNQVWMKENLRVTKYSDGTPMDPNSEVAVYNLTTNTDTLTNFGRLYSQTAILSGKNVCPTGWHVPTDADWNVLLAFVGGPNWQNDRLITGLKLMEPGTTATGGLWNVQAIAATNVSGFTGRPGGQGYHSAGWVSFVNMGLIGNWWSYVDAAAADRYTLDGNTGEVSRGEGTPGEGYSVRCIKD